MRKLFFFIAVLSCVEAFSQLPTGVSQDFGYNYYRFKRYLRADSGLLIPTRNTNWVPIAPAIQYWAGKLYYYNPALGLFVPVSDSVNSGVSVVDRGISDWRKQNWNMSQNLGFTHRTENKQSAALPTTSSFVHELLHIDGRLFGLTRTVPNRLIRFNNPDDLSVRDSINFTGYGDCGGGMDMVYVPQKGRIYATLFNNDCVTNSIIEINPSNLSWSVVASRGTPGWNYDGLVSDGAFLYTAVGANSSQADSIVKINLTDFTATATAITGSNNSGYIHALEYDGTHIYATEYGINPGKIYKILPSDLSVVSSASFTSGDQNPTDDHAFAGEYLWVGLETSSGFLLRIKKSDLSITRVNTGNGSQSYGVFFDGKYIWNTHNTTPGRLTRINPETVEIWAHTLDTGENQPNELITDGQRYFISTYSSPGRILRMSVPLMSYVSGGPSSPQTWQQTLITGSALTQNNTVAGAKYNLTFSDMGVLTVSQTAQAAVSGANGTANVSPLTVTGGNGGATSYSTGTVSAGNAGNINLTGGNGGAITGTPTTGIGGSGGTINITAGDGGLGTTFGGAGGAVEIQGGAGGGGTSGGSAGYASIKGGNAGSTGNADGGHVYIVPGIKNGSGRDGQIFLGLSPSNTVRGSVTIGSSTVEPSAKLDVVSTTQGFLPPRMSASQMNAISAPVAGLMIYNTDSATYCVYTGSAWRKLGIGSSSGISSLNGQTGSSQAFQEGDGVQINSTGDVHTFTLKRDTLIFTFGAGANLAPDTAAIVSGALLGSFYWSYDTMVLVRIRATIQGTGDTVSVQLHRGPNLNGSGSTAILSASMPVNSTTVGNTTTTFSSQKIPPSNHVWAKLDGVVSGRKPEYLTITVEYYIKKAAT